MSRALALVPAFAAALATLAPRAQAQACPGIDGLDGACWEPVVAQLPDFPGLDLPGLGLSWTNCSLDEQNDVQVTLTKPLAVSCGQYEADLRVTATGQPAPLLRGTVVLDYTRTWLELGTGATQYQVWRFTAKVDATGDPQATPLAPVPNCLGTWPTAFFYGYLDLAIECNTGGWAGALVLFHNSDAWIHGHFNSMTPGFGFHPATNFALVAPHTAVNPFDTTGVMAAPDGAPVSGYVRNVGNPDVPGLCTTADPISHALSMMLGQVCLSGFGPYPGRGSATHLRGAGTCVDSTGTPTWFHPLGQYFLKWLMPQGTPWVYLQTTAIGMWSTDDAFPGRDWVVVAEGYYLFHDAQRSAAGKPALSLDVFYGAATAGGYPVVSLTGEAMSQIFIDIASNYSKTPPVAAPFVGGVLPTKHLIYMNIGAN